MSALPEVITHNYHPEAVFLANLCDLSPDEAEKILQHRRDSGWRATKENYFRRRLETETWLIAERQRLLGHTRLARPVYFFLGDFADGKDPSRPCSLVMPLALFSPKVLTFTFPDSMASLPIATLESHRPERRPYHGKVFTLQEIEEVIEEFGLPDKHWQVDHLRRFDRFIEVQVWDDRPILEFLDRSGSSAAITIPHLG
ncbi:MAG: hypothetical protein JWL86_3725 [Rhizobium sp.]|nr:hypothetical protein [Rhizobium sp.]